MPVFLTIAACCVPIAIAGVVAARGFMSRNKTDDEAEFDLRDIETFTPDLTAGEEPSK